MMYNAYKKVRWKMSLTLALLAVLVGSFGGAVALYSWQIHQDNKTATIKYVSTLWPMVASVILLIAITFAVVSTRVH
ncbi:MAG: hypothetical protein WC246_02090 [Candidatus Paceibacterota bacterium]